MTRDAALDQIKVVVEKVLDRDMSDFDADTRLFEELNVDSTGILEILMELEDGAGFEVDVDSLDPSTFQTAGGLADYVAQMTAGV